MMLKYGYAPDEQVHSNESDVVKQIYRLLLAKEKRSTQLDYMFTTLLFRLQGLNKVLMEPPELITVLSLLESARNEHRFHLYRKAILDSCNIMSELIAKAGDSAC